MKCNQWNPFFVSLPIFLAMGIGFSATGYASDISLRLPPSVLPQLGCWFWQDREFEPLGYKEFLDVISTHSSYAYLTTSLRAPLKEVTDDETYSHIKAAAVYARERGVSLVMDLDVRLARRAFQKQYPNELQEMLMMQEFDLSASEEIQIEIHSRELSDHYTFNTTPYVSLQGKLLRVYSYNRGSDGIDSATLQDITSACRVVEAASASVKAILPAAKNRKACVMASFARLTPDVFAPHIMEFQRAILQQYADVPLAGVCKDEWGFPPCFDGNPNKNEFGYSAYRAQTYAQETGGRDLLFDCLLMTFGVQGRERERIAAINRFMQMSCRRNGDIEQDFYRSVKEIFGAAAVVATHPTWWPYPEAREFMKNGLDWWIARRDWAQTDETTPFAVRTALAKKWNSPVWYNMYYSGQKSDYERSVWTHALAGGRINYHPIYPADGDLFQRSFELLRGDLAKAESRVRLLNFITKSPLDCPVAVIFGHACAMNWAGPAYNDVGMEMADVLWRAGYPADLIPSSEIENGSLRMDEEGCIKYGPQRYSAVILYHPEFETTAVSRFFQKAASGPTALYRLGDWTRDFEGNPFDGAAALPPSMKALPDISSLAADVIQTLQTKGIAPQTPASSKLEGFSHISSSPSTEGFCRLIDGTVILIAGTNNIAGDPIEKNLKVQNRETSIEAAGVAAVRLDDHGRLDGLAAGALRKFELGSFRLTLRQPVDLALWRDRDGSFTGAIQDCDGPIPEELMKITCDWMRISSPLLNDE
ncbi:MAG: hypothetical protein AB1656_11360 [Candidatus Omnitrophota bacterium]